ncbi:MAG: hypothetical protein H7Y33_13090 [Cytophagales bacterium]|nr:hypothetical protein [Rhizobacter sp.]
MKSHHTPALPALLVLLATLSACGGGDSTDAPPSAPLANPSSGAYGWTLKASGPTSALKHGLSLVHPSLPDNEYVIEVASEAITDTRLVLSGTVNAGQRSAGAIQPHALLYIFGGDVRSVPMQANGTAPLSRVKRSNTNSACRFLLAANDHATADNSRFIVSTGGADGVCGTADDGRAEVRLSSSATLGYTVLAGDKPLGVARDPATLAPRGWIYPRHVELWGTPATSLPTRATGTALTSVVASTFESALVADGTQMSVLNFGSGNTVTEVPLNGALTAGTGWQLIGFDANAFYVYDGNSANTFNSPLRVLRITRVNPVATQLAAGTGLIGVASMGTDVLYLTVFLPAGNQLVTLNKAGGVRSDTTYPITTKPTVQTGANGRHQLWFVTGVGSANVSHSIDIIDESGVLLHSAAGGFPMGMAEAGTENFNNSESRTRFIFAQGFGARAFADASLVSYDTLTNSPSVLGVLPGAADYGADYVFASATGGPGSFGVGFATRSNGGNYAEPGSRVFSYELGSAASMKTTTRR